MVLPVRSGKTSFRCHLGKSSVRVRSGRSSFRCHSGKRQELRPKMPGSKRYGRECQPHTGWNPHKGPIPRSGPSSNMPASITPVAAAADVVMSPPPRPPAHASRDRATFERWAVSKGDRDWTHTSMEGGLFKVDNQSKHATFIKTYLRALESGASLPPALSERLDTAEFPLLVDLDIAEVTTVMHHLCCSHNVGTCQCAGIREQVPPVALVRICSPQYFAGCM
jgi:hypothetical protein